LRKKNIGSQIANAFCVDLEEWFHICGVETQYLEVSTWDQAEECVVRGTHLLLDLLDEANAKGTFLVLGWVAEKYPKLIQEISDRGHECGCHGYYHRLVFEQTPAEFRIEVSDARARVQDLTGQVVECFRAPSFSITAEVLWAFDILAEEGFKTDISVVPATRADGGIDRFDRFPFLLHTERGNINVYPVSVMRILRKTIPFSGGGYLRFFPLSLIERGFRQNHEMGLPVMTYIHPREVMPEQPRLALPLFKRFKYYHGLERCLTKLRALLSTYQFTTVSGVLEEYGPLPERTLRNGIIT
jgi:polysaccharide deacetylase family protein (PEP-CTERM system associated)